MRLRSDVRAEEERIDLLYLYHVHISLKEITSSATFDTKSVVVSAFSWPAADRWRQSAIPQSAPEQEISRLWSIVRVDVFASKLRHALMSQV
jgi:hypothetical protein